MSHQSDIQGGISPAALDRAGIVSQAARRGGRFATALAAVLAAAGLLVSPDGAIAQSGGTLRVAMTAADIPTTTGMPNNGFEGMRFLGYPIFEGLTLWDLTRSDVPAGIRPGLAEKWTQDKADPIKWIFTLRRGVKFHDGSDFNADAVIWNLERFYNPQSKQFEAQGGAISRARNSWLKAWRKIDDFTVEISTNRPVSYFPYVITYTLIASPTQFEKTGASWAEFAKAPAGTGPFKITEVKPRVSVELSRNTSYWDKNRIPKIDKMVLTPMPEPTTRLAALRSGQVDWIEVPPPDAVPSLKQAGFEVVTGVYPHVWPWVFNLDKADSPWKDVRVRQAANYCVDRDGMVKLLNGLAYPSVGYYTKANPLFGKPKNAYTFDPPKAKALLKEVGFGPDKPVKAKIMISTSGSGQMLPLPMNEFLQQSMKQCGFDVTFEVVEWGAMLVAFRNPPGAQQALGSDAINISLVSSDVSRMAGLFLGSNFPPNGANWGHWKNEVFDGALLRIERSSDPKEIEEQTRRAHEQLVDDAPWLWIVHDGNPRAMTKKVKGFANAQSWFQDFTLIEMK
jgi:peptide/nickel transport system substrate-binding protein